MTWTERLKRDLEEDGATVEPREPHGLVVTSYEGRGEDEVPVLELAMSEAEIDAYITAEEPYSGDTWPDVSLKEASYRFFLIHIMEFVDTCHHKRLTLKIVGDDLEATTTPPCTGDDCPEREPLPDLSGGPYYWSAYPPEGYRKDQSEGATRQ